MQPKDVQRGDRPRDRLTRICAGMTRAFDGHIEHREGDKCIVFLDAGDVGGLVMHGYEDDREAIVNLLIHLKAMFRANGMDLDFMSLGDEGVNRA